MPRELEPDIQNALEYMESADGGGMASQGATDWVLNGKMAAVHLSDFAQENPMWALTAAVGTFGCYLLCPYFGAMIGAGLLWWCAQRK